MEKRTMLQYAVLVALITLIVTGVSLSGVCIRPVNAQTAQDAKTSEEIKQAIEEVEAKKQQEAEYRRAIRNLDEMTTTAVPDSHYPLVGETGYTLGKNDIVEILVRGQGDFSGQFIIGPDGMIQYNYVGDVPAEGLTKYELREVLTEELKRFVKVPDVSVSIVGYNSKTFYVLGDVGHPGKFAMRGDTIKLRDALVVAGLPNRTAALKRAVVITPDETNPKIVKVNLKDLLYKGILRDDVDLKTGDLIVVPSSRLSSINWHLDQILGPLYKAAYLADFGGVDLKD
ncbi:MAG: polysaccharide biosynthesis/export family protein [Candidatus Omnitrophica bacterium]|nr:polysaccharide biosynthesis/export family protein [Candidatus Omnitrophota bacterium]